LAPLRLGPSFFLSSRFFSRLSGFFFSSRFFDFSSDLRSPPRRQQGARAARRRAGAALPRTWIRDLVGVTLVGIAGAADAAREVHAGALLQHVRGLVRRGVQARRLAERHVVAKV
jgi:hypothetical protein